MKVVYCSGLNYMKYAPDHMGIKQGMGDLGWDWSVVDSVIGNPSGEEIAENINTINPDMVIYGNTIPMNKCVCLYVKPEITQIFWMLDYRLKEALDQDLACGWGNNSPYLTAIFHCAADDISLWKEIFKVPVYFAPQACYIPDQLEYSDEFSFDLLFIGGNDSRPGFEARIELLAQINELSCVSITQINESDPTKRNEVFRNIPLYYHSSKLVLDISNFWDNWGYTSSRYWHSATLGACSLTKRFPGSSTFFPEDVRWYFDTAEEAADLVEILLDHTDERERTKRRVAEYAWRNHSYKIRFQKMLRCLETGKQVDMH